MLCLTCGNTFDRARLKTGRVWREKLAFLNAGCTHPKPGVFPPLIFTHKHRLIEVCALRGLTLPFFEERDPGSTPTALWKRDGCCVHSCIATCSHSFLRFSFFTLVLTNTKRNARLLIFRHEVRERFFFEWRKNNLSRPFCVREISNPKFLVWGETADFLSK